MKVLCFGSANLDHVYKVNHFTVPGETQGCLEYTVKCGGKGVNQECTQYQSKRTEGISAAKAWTKRGSSSLDFGEFDVGSL
mgnify:CR=1 FL=1